MSDTIKRAMDLLADKYPLRGHQTGEVIRDLLDIIERAGPAWSVVIEVSKGSGPLAEEAKRALAQARPKPVVPVVRYRGSGPNNTAIADHVPA